MVEIIPKKTKAKLPLQNIFLFSSATLLLAAIFSYVIFLRSQANTLLAIEDTEAAISAIGTSEDRENETKLFLADKKIEDYMSLRSDWKRSSKFFENLDALIHPQVQLLNMDFDVNGIKTTISGDALDFISLEQQLLFLQGKKDLVESYDLSDVSLQDDGSVAFELIIYFTPAIFNDLQ